MEGDTAPSFRTPQEEVAFYREQALKYESKWREAQLELDEFQASSRDLEAELESQLAQYEASNRELRSMVARLQVDNEGLQASAAACLPSITVFYSILILSVLPAFYYCLLCLVEHLGSKRSL
ncbi:hypothetical protein HPB48_025196 [Haemaphysalis longicornis]|uniref:Uncharacterized protein n=1 Tax=Haemaphysalis longicornis TaxID=44386 RepID=A0A9J6HA02_HAELO|nr:hypothetical protein HPB48_025196 [Haemaphysalis longicornis]